MGFIEDIDRVVNLFADHFVSSKNITFLRHVAFLPFEKTKLIEINFLTSEISPKEVETKIFNKTIDYYKEMIYFELTHSGLEVEKLNKFSLKLAYKPGDLTRYYTVSVLMQYDGKDYTKSVLSSFS